MKTCAIIFAAALFMMTDARAQQPAPLEFRAKDAKLTVDGSLINYDPRPEFNTIGGWNKTNGFATWSVPDLPKGTYRVIIEYACAGDNPGSEFEIIVGSQRANFKVTTTGGWSTFKEMDLGPIIIRKAGPTDIIARVTRVARRWAINIRTVRLVPEP